MFCTKNTTPAASKPCGAGEVPVRNAALKLISWKSLRGYLGKRPLESPPATMQGAAYIQGETEAHRRLSGTAISQLSQTTLTLPGFSKPFASAPPTCCNPDQSLGLSSP